MVALDGDVASAGDGAGTVANSPQRELVNYRLENWKTAHAESGKKGEQLVATLKKLRCEVSVSSHGGHQDVKYRCVKWQQLSLKSHKEAHQWEAWLKQYGFATKHEH
ncbi:hypothetical protein CGZ80_22020 [Rhodopirellula sp. MGV]|nr:hypothetical protein CGZ80_22020 [Rhodopirellula sp. MGV]PNY34738.1 hypothetical protein C2E31_21685 [Rhodopirellula baltica]